ncbi:MAG TPA: helicase-related protein [Acidobacteriota bacterium]|nr:helicase-related protein [Acidobacteriota bacterium]HNT18661.1 helicase-related protein [Acidobacteriota bacterium]
MAKLEDLKPFASVRGITPDGLVTVINVQWFGSDALELTFKDASGRAGNQLLYRDNEARIEVVEQGAPWSFDGDGELFRLVSEAHRIRLAYLFDPLLAIHTSIVDPLPHQIRAVYQAMLPRQPLRYLLAQDPGSGKTIMAGLLIKELIMRGDLRRCLVISPGNLVEQWQDEMNQKFHLPFEIMTNDKLEAARTGNWLGENNLVIARLDKCSRDESVQAKLQAPSASWDLVVVDEAHKMSATFFGGEVKYTQRYNLGKLLSGTTRHLLLLTATPHNGKQEDFQLFMALLDGDRFEGKFRDGVHTVDVSDLMMRAIKEDLIKFDGTPLFPERIAYTAPYQLSEAEADLYKNVTDYVREEFNRAEALKDDKRAGTVGFALTILQRRLASSPEAIYQSLRRRKERLESRLSEMEILQRAGKFFAPSASYEILKQDDIDDLEDAPDDEVAQAEEEVLDQATAARTMEELKEEISTLKRLEALALAVRKSGEDRKWCELSNIFKTEIFTAQGIDTSTAERTSHYGSGKIPKPKASPSQKLVVFTEHRDTLNYLKEKLTTLFGKQDAVVSIHGGMGREERQKMKEAFLHDPDVRVLVATDAAGEGINLQRAHLMVNYDLPWNPNRIEQRFGRIHRIGQTEVCHLWNLIADGTREGDVYRKLLDKLEKAREDLGGQVFDVLGKLQFEGKPLRELLIEAIRYGEKPEVRAKLNMVVENAFDKKQLQDLFEEKALVHDVLDESRLAKIREDMDRAEARRLQPFYVESFFLEAFKRIGGKSSQREPRRYEITNVPASLRNLDRIMGTSAPLLQKYERIAFEKHLIAPPGELLAAFVCPGHPLLDATIDLTLERNRELLRRGTVLVDENDWSDKARVLFSIEHAIQDASITPSGEQRVISRRVLFVEMDETGSCKGINYAPYLDYRPLKKDEPSIEEIVACPELKWITKELENKALGHAIANVAPGHLNEVMTNRIEWIKKARAAVKDRLAKEINYWDHRAQELKYQEQAGKTNAKINSQEAQRRANELAARLDKRIKELDREEQISSRPPVVLGGFVVVSAGLLAKITGKESEIKEANSPDTQAAAAKAREMVMEAERRLGYEPVDRELDKLGYDIESRDPKTGRLRFIEVKGRISGATTVTVTKNEVLYSLNQPDNFILAIVQFFEDMDPTVHYIRQPFKREPDFGVTSVNYDFAELLKKAEYPR